MKKIFLVISVAILIALFSAPSSVKALDSIGKVVVLDAYGYYESEVLGDANTTTLYDYGNGYWFPSLYFYNRNQVRSQLSFSATYALYIPTLTNTQVLSGKYAYNVYEDYLYAIPEQFWPEGFPPDPTVPEQLWDAFYDLYEDVFGYRPMPGSLFDILRALSLGDDDVSTEIIFPTLTPTPTPTPAPTPIPVQTIFVPDGNGNTTIIYQYPDPTTGVITQSPYNPNIENNITVNCECDGSSGSGGNTFGTNPQDPYTLTSSMLWADGFGVEISDNPLTAANESQQTLAEAASEYADSVNVASNSFNILPVKWLTLVGLLGGILIIAGLIRTFLGG